MELQDGVAVVTGAASGIGRACALAFAREGMHVVVADRDEEGVRDVAAEIGTLGRQSLAVSRNVGIREQVESLVEGAIAWQGHVDVFMSNAGVAVGGPPHRIPLDDWEWIVDINLWSHVWAVRKILPHMLGRGRGHLVHTASAAGLMGAPSMAPYVVTKFGVVGLAESLAVYCADKGVGVSVLCPMFVSTNIGVGARGTPEEGVSVEEAERMREMTAEFIKQAGIPPEQVADDVVDAVRANRLYVLPHPEVKDIVLAKWDDPDAWVRNAASMWGAMSQMPGAT